MDVLCDMEDAESKLEEIGIPPADAKKIVKGFRERTGKMRCNWMTHERDGELRVFFTPVGETQAGTLRISRMDRTEDVVIIKN